ncbi:gliding motility protein RemB [Hyunsoonleella ulvae]|uniref:gliding motility protein RemB n=1 Tax=Hyunsoonleella ulvae TaxID=2799948 RepID=UPI00193ABFE7|nr:gliding motility protein RemB [Hyunsoonleella ulvae]
MKQFVAFLLFICHYTAFSQNENIYEKPPIFPKCANMAIDSLQQCFDSHVFQHIKDNFKVPQNVIDEDYKGKIVVLFEVDTTGAFRVMYVDAMYDTLKQEAQRVFNLFPKITPATYSGRKTFRQYSIPIQIPIEDFKLSSSKNTQGVNKIEQQALATKQEFDSVNTTLKPYTNRALRSQLNIQFTHSDYARFDRVMNLVGTNSHTAQKPFLYEDVSKYYDFEVERKTLKKDAKTWAGKKIWNEHLVQIEGKDYWFTIDPIFDLQTGTDSEGGSTYNNTRGIWVQGGLGKKFNFYTTIFESQGRFADYVNRYIESIRASGSEPVVPGRGVSKRFKTDSYDYPAAEAYLSYSPAKFLNVQFGHGKNFIGDGYRSLILSDVTSPHPFLKLNTNFWKIKYTNTFMWMRDVRPEVKEDGAFLTKYIANHYLSWNVSKRLNLGFFESVLWTNSNNRGFDVNYLNPIIFYRAIEFETGQDAGNALLGASGKYKFNDNVNVYGQFILDEFSLGDVRAGNKSWKNKFGYQLGVKYYNAFNVDNLLLQLELNRVRPYTYSHNTIVLNYGHNNQPVAHLWGANFSEVILIGRYRKDRWFADARLIFGTRGFDVLDGTDNFNYGGNIYRVEGDRPADTGIEIGQGIKTKTFYGNLQAGYIINPASNLKLFTDITVRNFNPDINTAATFKNDTVWLNFGLRTDLFNWYFDN